ncbi:hypothetical protein HOO65_040783 [Ceratocystis lukuohia]|uniref:ADF-H domain-containing protein n=1 Tax=Ceratocystis lukuohia TaxID=2019550 RepID=A0ABR4MJN7_9PEZI
MSLNGLEDPAVLAAFETATGESGGWFLVKYASRDEVELHGSGNGGNTEIREAVANYADPSPLYGFLNYRDKKIILKYQPEDCSRLVQARATVHFNMICDRFQPYDHLYEISEASQLQDSKLEVVCGFQPAEPTTPPVPASPSSPASPQRRRRLGEIAEEDDEDQEPNATRLKSKHIDDDAQELGSSDMAVGTSVLTGPPVTLNSDLAKSPDGSNFASTDSPPTFIGISNDQYESPVDSLESPGRPSSQSVRTADLYPYPSYKPKVKLGPRPSEAPGRPGSSNSSSFRSISSLPAGFKASKAKKERKNRDKDRDKDEPDSSGDIPEIAIDSTGLVVPESQDGRPHTSSGTFAAGLSSMIPPPPSPTASLPSPKDRITPEKARLMKAMKLREKKMNKAQGQDKPILSLADATDAVDVSNETDTNVSPMTADALENAVDDDDADTTTDGPSQLEDDESQPSMLNIDSDSSPTTTVNTDSEVSIESARAKTVTNDQVSELTLSESHPPSPVLDVSEITNSTKESSVSESTNDTDHSDDIKGNAIEDNVLSENQIEAVSKEVSVDNIEDEAIDEVPETPKAIGVIKEAASECVHVEATSEEATAVTEPSSTEEQEPIEKEAVTTKLEAQEPKVETEKAEEPEKSENLQVSELVADVQTKEPEVVEQTETSKESVAIGEPKLAVEAKTSQEPKAEVHVIDSTDSSSIAVVSGSDSSISVEKNEDVEPTQETVPVPAKASEEVTKDATVQDAVLMPPPPRPTPKAEIDDEKSPKRRPSEPICTDVSKKPSAESGPDKQAKRGSVDMDHTPITPLFPAPSLRSSSPSRPYSSSSTRTVSQPTLRASAVILPTDVTSSSARSVSSGAGAAYIHKIAQQSSSGLAPKSQGKIGSSISQRIKALEQLSGSTNPGVPPPRQNTSSTFYSVRKSVIMDPPRSPSVSERGGSALGRSPSRRSRESVIIGSTNRDRSSSVASRMSRFELDRGESVQVTTRIVRHKALPREDKEDEVYKNGHNHDNNQEWDEDKVTDQEVDEQNATDGPHHTVTLGHRLSTLNPDKSRPISPVRSSAHDQRVSRDLSRRTGSAADGESEVSQQTRDPERMHSSEDNDHSSSLSPTSYTDSSAASFVSTSASVSTSTTKRPRRRSSLTIVKDFIKDRRRSITSSHDASTTSQSPSRPPSTSQNNGSGNSTGGYRRRLSIGSHRSSASREREAADGAKSPTQNSDIGSGDDNDRRLGKAGRFMQRLSSGFSSTNSRTSRSPINMAPTVQEETIAAMGTAAVKARPKLKPTGDPEVTFMGDVNVQFPDNLLWKRRTMGLDNLGFLILTPVTASGTRPDKLGGAALKRFHLSDFKMPYVPDMELQELPNSVCLDFIEGSSLQIACGDRNGQVSILSALQAAHKTYST